VTDRVSISAAAADCERYWRAAGIGRRTASEMRQELENHLAEAIADGRSVEAVIGDDLGAFAREWAAAQRARSAEAMPSWDEVISGRGGLGRLMIAILGAIAVALAVAIVWGRGGESDMDNEMWRWIWIGAAAIFGVGEMFTAGFFMLPFAFGAVAALPLAWLDVHPLAQLVVFLAVSITSLLLIQRMMKRADERQPAVGANRFLNRTAIVTEEVDRATGTGRVRVETELWRATTDGAPIPEGTDVRVVEVRGTRLVVEAE
jgi:membrane protein implicated in regulation of membrane protease activity